VATLGRAPRESSTPEIRDKRLTIPLKRKLVIQRNLLIAELVLVPEENGRIEMIPKIIISKNSRRRNHPLSIVK
jgi:hypothetical protein